MKELYRIDEKYHIKVGETDENKFITLQTASCFGNCGAAPMMMVGEDTFGCLDPEKTFETIAAYEDNEEEPKSTGEVSEV